VEHRRPLGVPGRHVPQRLGGLAQRVAALDHRRHLLLDGLEWLLTRAQR
jgi:hypothetical protein